jgi:hypothetical protein
MLEVVNVRKMISSDDLVYIGRASGRFHGSALGNPFRIGSHGTREQVIEKYRIWLWKMIRNRDERVISELKMIVERVRNGENLYLGCWCAPSACHGDIIVRCVNWIIESGYEL